MATADRNVAAAISSRDGGAPLGDGEEGAFEGNSFGTVISISGNELKNRAGIKLGSTSWSALY